MQIDTAYLRTTVAIENIEDPKFKQQVVKVYDIFSDALITLLMIQGSQLTISLAATISVLVLMSDGEFIPTMIYSVTAGIGIWLILEGYTRRKKRRVVSEAVAKVKGLMLQDYNHFKAVQFVRDVDPTLKVFTERITRAEPTNGGAFIPQNAA